MVKLLACLSRSAALASSSCKLRVQRLEHSLNTDEHRNLRDLRCAVPRKNAAGLLYLSTIKTITEKDQQVAKQLQNCSVCTSQLLHAACPSTAAICRAVLPTISVCVGSHLHNSSLLAQVPHTHTHTPRHTRILRHTRTQALEAAARCLRCSKNATTSSIHAFTNRWECSTKQGERERAAQLRCALLIAMARCYVQS